MIPDYLYSTIFLYSVLILTICATSKLSTKDYKSISRVEDNSLLAGIVFIVFALFIGMRPVTAIFGDTWVYNYTYSLMQNHIQGAYSSSSEWIWLKVMTFLSQHYHVSVFFTLVSVGYFGFSLWACRILTPNNVFAAFIFILGGLSFFTYGTNGIRNGLACSITLVAMAMIAAPQRKMLLSLTLIFVAFNIHHSIIVPVASLFASLYVVKNFKWAYTFWILSILISLMAGDAVIYFFASLGFDDRVSYLTAAVSDGKFSHIGFRWDFLIYSMMPIALGYYAVIRRGIRNNTYELLLNTYTLANAFWVMVIRANFSNRFAYLSWFMYPIVLAYPLFRLNIWGNLQGKRASQIMLAHIAFTWFMETFYW